MKKILIVANDVERWGPSRLPQPLAEWGIEIAVLCSGENPLSQSSFVSCHYQLGKLKSWRDFGNVFGKVMEEWKPDLVIPCDEPVVVMLHFFLKNRNIAARYLNEQQINTLRRSIGHVDRLDAMVLKHQTRLLAESLGVPVPRSQLVTSATEAAKAAADIGFPVFLKKSFSWAGQGSIRCRDMTEVKTVFENLRSGTSWPRKMARQFFGRDWYPSDSAIEVQKEISGDSVMFSVAALEGKVLAGLFASRATRLGATGPSTIVSIGDNAQCRWAAEKMIAAMGASGFLAFDFMRCENTEDMFLLECNPRPNQICHLGRKVGVDLCRALNEGLSDLPLTAGRQTSEANVPLFPQEWLRDEQTALKLVQDMDIPATDPKLLNYMLRCGRKRGNSIESLLAALGAQTASMSDHTFG